MKLRRPEKEVHSPVLMLSTLMLGVFTGLFSETALNMALTQLMHEFSVVAGVAQWLVTGYLLTLAVFMPASIILMKWFSTRSLIIIAISLSFLGCLISGVSENMMMLMTGRIVQAIGTAILLPVLMSAALLIFPLHHCGKVMGVVGVSITLAPALGPTISGLIITVLNWRAIFFICASMYIAALLLAIVAAENVGDITHPRIDVISLLLSSIGFGGIICGLAALSENPASSVHFWGVFLMGILCLIALFWRQTRIRYPLINTKIFSCPIFTVGSLIMMMSIMSVLATAIILPIYFIDVLVMQPAMAGLILLPGNIVNVLFSPLIGALYNRYAMRPFIVLGSLCLALSATIFLIITHGFAEKWAIASAFMLLCFGVTCIIMPVQTAALSSLPKSLYSDGTSVWNTLYQISGAAGASIAISLMSSFTARAMNGKASTPEIFALSSGIHSVFYFILFLGLASLVVSFWLREPQQRTSSDTLIN